MKGPKPTTICLRRDCRRPFAEHLDYGLCPNMTNKSFKRRAAHYKGQRAPRLSNSFSLKDATLLADICSAISRRGDCSAFAGRAELAAIWRKATQMRDRLEQMKLAKAQEAAVAEAAE
jgi:hypothetical protein